MSDDRSTGGERRPPRDDGPERRPRRDGEQQRPARSQDDQERRPRREDEQDRPRRRPEGGPPRRESDAEAPRQREERPFDALAASRLALDALQSLTNRAAEGVIGVERADDGGWVVVVELLEASRIPATSDVLGEYEVEIGSDRSLRSYNRRARYTRASTMND